MYDDQSFEPVSRLVQDRQDTSQIKVYHYHNNHLGTPQELTDDGGNVVWANYEYAWGGTYQSYYKEQSLNDITIKDYELQPIKFQGQSLDIETGLHYNRFRYYDSDVGMFIQRDPIGLLGGLNTFQYAPNPIGWVDPWGLIRVGRWMGSGKYNQMKSTGKVIESVTGTTHVAIPANINAFGKQAKNNALYVEFDVPDGSVRITNSNDGWGSILGPKSLDGRLAAKKGLPIPQMPNAENIEIVGKKIDGEVTKC